MRYPGGPGGKSANGECICQPKRWDAFVAATGTIVISHAVPAVSPAEVVGKQGVLCVLVPHAVGELLGKATHYKLVGQPISRYLPNHGEA